MADDAKQFAPVTVSVHVNPPGGVAMPGIYLCLRDPSGQALVLEMSPALARNVADLLDCGADIVEGGTPVVPTMRKDRQ